MEGEQTNQCTDVPYSTPTSPQLAPRSSWRPTAAQQICQQPSCLLAQSTGIIQTKSPLILAQPPTSGGGLVGMGQPARADAGTALSNTNFSKGAVTSYSTTLPICNQHLLFARCPYAANKQLFRLVKQRPGLTAEPRTRTKE